MHVVLGLVGEAGEASEKVKTLVRDKDSDPDKLADRQRRAVLGGAGDNR